MPKKSTEPTPAPDSRRSFLLKLGVGAAALAAVSLPFLRLGRGSAGQTSEMSQAFPGEDSIFHPASDPRLDPRRNKQG